MGGIYNIYILNCRSLLKIAKKGFLDHCQLLGQTSVDSNTSVCPYCGIHGHYSYQCRNRLNEDFKRSSIYKSELLKKKNNTLEKISIKKKFNLSSSSSSDLDSMSSTLSWSYSDRKKRRM